MGSKCPGSRARGRGVGRMAEEQSRPRESPHPPSARRFLILGNFLNAPGQAPHFLPAAAPAPVRPHSRPCPQRQMRRENPGQGSGGQSARVPGGEVALGGRRGGGERPGERSTRLPGTEARGQGPSYT